MFSFGVFYRFSTFHRNCTSTSFLIFSCIGSTTGITTKKFCRKEDAEAIREISYETNFTLFLLSDELIAIEAEKYKRLSEPFKILVETSLEMQLPQSQIYPTLSYRALVVLQSVFVQRKFGKHPMTSFEMLEKIVLTIFDWYIQKEKRFKPNFIADSVFWIKEHLSLFHQKFATVMLMQNYAVDNLEPISNFINKLGGSQIRDEVPERLVRNRLRDGIIRQNNAYFQFVSPMFFDYFLVAEILRLLSQKKKVSLTGVFSRLNRSKQYENAVKLVDEVIPTQSRASQQIYFELNSARIKNS